jgi:hypothetical protein
MNVQKDTVQPIAIGKTIVYYQFSAKLKDSLQSCKTVYSKIGQLHTLLISDDP